jgi:beta-aspartyl-peptidase (threonine type)
MAVKSSVGVGGGVALLVHGGAGDSEGVRLDGQIDGCHHAASVGRKILDEGGTALDAVTAAVRALEDDARFNAGTGGALTLEGTLELDASIMDGTTLRAGGVCALPGFKNPVDIARAVLEEGRHVLYAGTGAVSFARANGFAHVDPATMITDEQREALERVLSGTSNEPWPKGTVGAVARDVHGHLAAATSTGGITGKRPGRVGDSPIIGAGTYADDQKAAASATGHGEGIVRVSLCARVVDAIAQGATPADAAYDALIAMKARVGSTGGLIVVGRDGTLGMARTTRSMAFAAYWHGHGIMTGG